MRSPEVQTAIDRSGGVSALARSLGIDHSTVSGWRMIPARHVAAVAAATGLALHELRPDLFPRQDPKGMAETQAPFAAEARALGLDPDKIAARALEEAVSAEKARRWAEENREAIEAHSRWVEQNGLPLAKYRMF
jgi:antitoxin CcdA